MTPNNDGTIESHERYLSPPEEPEYDHPIVCRKFRANVTIRARDTGVMMYAVYDGERQVSAEVGPLNDVEAIAFAEGYAANKQRFSGDNEAMLEALKSGNTDELFIGVVNDDGPAVFARRKPPAKVSIVGEKVDHTTPILE